MTCIYMNVFCSALLCSGYVAMYLRYARLERKNEQDVCPQIVCLYQQRNTPLGHV